MKTEYVIALNAIDAAVASTNSGAIPASLTWAMSVQVIATGAPVGVVKIQASNDNTSPLTLNNVTNWTDISSATVAVGASGSFLIPKLEVCYSYVRVVYTKTSGTGAITANYFAQSV